MSRQNLDLLQKPALSQHGLDFFDNIWTAGGHQMSPSFVLDLSNLFSLCLFLVVYAILYKSIPLAEKNKAEHSA